MTRTDCFPLKVAFASSNMCAVLLLLSKEAEGRSTAKIRDLRSSQSSEEADPDERGTTGSCLCATQGPLGVATSSELKSQKHH